MHLLAAGLRGLTDQPGADRIDAVALGCTHYPLLLPELRSTMFGRVS
jgi:glutamate racemase